MTKSDSVFPELSGDLTKRELFAAMAMQGLLSFGKITTSAEAYAGQAVITADALIAELAKEPKP